MQTSKKNKHVVLSLSGGMDSSTVLLRCLLEYKSVTAISFDYGQKHSIELERAKDLVEYLNKDPFRKYPSDHDDGGYGVKYSKITHQIVNLSSLTGLLDSALVTGGKEVPEGHYEQENMKATVVPNRNKIFASIIQAAALSIVTRTGVECDIAMGIHSGDHAIYPDCRQEFRDADFKAFQLGNWDSEKVNIYTPYIDGDKFDILKDGEKLCKSLLLNFNEVYSRTNTSYKPIMHKISPSMSAMVIPKEKWFSDYKSASSVERVEAFIKLGRPDPVEYANENGPVTWEHVVEEVSKVLNSNT